MDRYVVELGRRIRARRHELKMKQAQLAERVGISTQYISHIEKGDQVMSVVVFSKICDALNSSADRLLYNRSIESRIQLSEEVESILADCSPTERISILHLIQEIKSILKEQGTIAE